MYKAPYREIGEYNDRVRLEVGVEFLRNYPEGQCFLFKKGISGFGLGQ